MQFKRATTSAIKVIRYIIFNSNAIDKESYCDVVTSTISQWTYEYDKTMLIEPLH